MHEIRILLDQSVRDDNHGQPTLVSKTYTGRRGRPKLVINEVFLTEASQLRKKPAIAKLLGVGRNTVERRFVEYGIRAPSPPRRLSDEELIEQVRQVLSEWRDMGVTMMAAELKRRFNTSVQRKRIANAMNIVEPLRPQVHRRRPVVRRTYSVPGPNFLWHHDGQHGEVDKLE